MAEYRLTEMEEKFADIIWSMEPIGSPELVDICSSEFNWKKSTTYTMLKRLEKKEIFKNENSIVSALVTREDFYAGKSQLFVEETFDGSLPRFLTAFTRTKKLSPREIDELQRLINEHREG